MQKYEYDYRSHSISYYIMYFALHELDVLLRVHNLDFEGKKIYEHYNITVRTSHPLSSVTTTPAR